MILTCNWLNKMTKLVSWQSYQFWLYLDNYGSVSSTDFWFNHYFSQSESVYHNNLQGINIVKTQIWPQMEPNSSFWQLFWSKLFIIDVLFLKNEGNINYFSFTVLRTWKTGLPGSRVFPGLLLVSRGKKSRVTLLLIYLFAVVLDPQICYFSLSFKLSSNIYFSLSKMPGNFWFFQI